MNLDDVDAFLDVSKPIVDGLREQAGGVKSLDDLCKASCDGAPSSSVVAQAVLVPATWADNDADLRVLWATLRLNGGGSMNTSALASASGVDVPDGSYSPLDDAMHSLNEIRDLLDTARQDDDNNRGTGSVDGNQHWSTNDLKAMIDNEDGYYTDEQVAHAKKVMALITASPEARELLGIDESGGGWSFSDIGHLTLDVLGMVPVVGNAADGINAAWYASEGEWLDAALSSMALIPAVGQAVTVSKPAIKAAAGGRKFSSLDEALEWAKKWLQDKGILKADGTPNPNKVDEVAGGEFVDDAIRTPRVDVGNKLDGLPRGNQSHVRTVSSEAELQKFYDEIATGGTPLSRPSYDGNWVQTADGVQIGFRNSSRSGGATLDIVFPDGTFKKVHIE